LKILLVQHRFPPAIGGSETHVYLLAKYLQRKGHNVIVLTTTSLSPNDIPTLKIFPPFINMPSNSVKLPLTENRDGINIKRLIPKFRYWSFIFEPGFVRELASLIPKVDVIHVHGYNIFPQTFLTTYYGAKYNKPVIHTAHDLVIPENLPWSAKILKKVYDITFGKYILENSSKLIALTHDQIYQYIEKGGLPKKVYVLPNGIELDKYIDISENYIEKIRRKYNIKDNEKVLLFVGRIEKYKNIQDVIKILPQIKEVIPEIKLVVAGKDYGFKHCLETLARNLGVDDSVIFTGRISDTEKIALYKIAKLFVFPSTMEGFGIVLLEAMAARTLPIAYPIPSVRKIIIHKYNGILARDRKEFADYILYYLVNETKRRKIEKRAYKFVQRFDIRKIVDKLEKIYYEALNES